MDTNHPTRCPSMTNLLRARRGPQSIPCSTLSNNHYTPSHTSSYILNHNHSTYG